MIYYISESSSFGREENSAASKPRTDVNLIFKSRGFLPIFLDHPKIGKNLFEKIDTHVKSFFIWEKAIESIKNKSICFVQFPLFPGLIFSKNIFKKAKKRDIKFIFFVHDLDFIRYPDSLKARMESKVLATAWKIIAHNETMQKKLLSLFPRTKIESLEIFDYLFEQKTAKNVLEGPNDIKKIIIAGNLSPKKAGFVYHLPNDVYFNLYGNNYMRGRFKQTHNITYFGSFPSSQLPGKLEGGFGLVWDGPSINECTGDFGRYLKVNNPYKASLYLACGKPIIIWKNAALAEFVNKNKCGLLVSSISDISSILEVMSLKEYRFLERNALKVGNNLKNGYYTNRAIDKSLTI